MVHTKFEIARLVGARALQIKMGAPILIKVPRTAVKPIDIARLELEQGVLPMSVRVREEKKKPPVKVIIPEIPLDEEDIEEVKEIKGEAAEEESIEEEIIVEDTE
jgi:DNA-directed RNA polymerase subunit K